MHASARRRELRTHQYHTIIPRRCWGAEEVHGGVVTDRRVYIPRLTPLHSSALGSQSSEDHNRWKTHPILSVR